MWLTVAYRKIGRHIVGHMTCWKETCFVCVGLCDTSALSRETRATTNKAQGILVFLSRVCTCVRFTRLRFFRYHTSLHGYSLRSLPEYLQGQDPRSRVEVTSALERIRGRKLSEYVPWGDCELPAIPVAKVGQGLRTVVRLDKDPAASP
jgi:hypothetical protein